jgi:hypothetical protein
MMFETGTQRVDYYRKLLLAMCDLMKEKGICFEAATQVSHN